jgi:hypothetical protein
MLRLSIKKYKGVTMSRKIILSVMLMLGAIFTLSALTLDGVVIGGETGLPVSGAEVELHLGNMEFIETATDENGQFVFTELESGNYHLHVAAEEYLPFMQMLLLEEDMTITIELQQGANPGELTGHLYGVISFENGGLAAGLPVNIGTFIPGAQPPHIHYETVTDETGYYDFSEIVDFVTYNLMIPLPGMPYMAEVAVAGETEFNVELVENPQDTGSLSGQVLDAETGESISGVELYLQRQWLTYTATTDEGGNYSFAEIEFGNYHILAGFPDYMQFNEMVFIDGEIEYNIALQPLPAGDLCLSGTVTDAETGFALGGVQIQLFGGQGNHNFAVTDEAGYYELTGLFAGVYQMMAFAGGWGTYEPFSGTLELYEDTVYDLAMVPVELPGSGSVSGAVYDAESGEPVSGALVHLASINGFPGGGNCWNHYQYETGEQGQFAFENVVTGEYILSGVAEGYLISFYDGASNPEEATIIEVLEDEAILADITLIPLVFHTVSGTVTDFVNNAPLSGSIVRAMLPGTGCNHWSASMTETDEEGNFEMELPAGDYVFSAEYSDPGQNDFMRQFYDHKMSPANADVVTLGTDISGIDFDLAMPEHYDNRISGTVSVAGGFPENPVLVAAISADGNQWESACVADMFGNYMLNNLPEGEYFVLAYEYNSVPTYYPGVVDFEDAELVVAVGIVTGIDFELIIPENSGIFQADGYVMNSINEPVANANVIIYDESGLVLSYAVTNSDGYYLVNGLPSGNLTGLATKVLYQSDVTELNVTTSGSADFVINPRENTENSQDAINPALINLSNYPNPFNPVTTISFDLPEASMTTLTIYNVSGQKVATLVQDELSAGIHNISWQGKSELGTPTASGIYFYKLRSGKYTITNKMVLMK